MELAKIRNLSDEELTTQVKTSAEQLFRIRFQMATDPSSGAKKLRELRKEIAQIKTVAKERQLGIRGAKPDTSAAKTVAGETAPAAAKKKKGAAK
jgi:large subunit ribosomal protein L29